MNHHYICFVTYGLSNIDFKTVLYNNRTAKGEHINNAPHKTKYTENRTWKGDKEADTA